MRPNGRDPYGNDANPFVSYDFEGDGGNTMSNNPPGSPLSNGNNNALASDEKGDKKKKYFFGFGKKEKGKDENNSTQMLANKNNFVPESTDNDPNFNSTFMPPSLGLAEPVQSVLIMPNQSSNYIQSARIGGPAPNAKMPSPQPKQEDLSENSDSDSESSEEEEKASNRPLPDLPARKGKTSNLDNVFNGNPAANPFTPKDIPQSSFPDNTNDNGAPPFNMTFSPPGGVSPPMSLNGESENSNANSKKKGLLGRLLGKKSPPKDNSSDVSVIDLDGNSDKQQEKPKKKGFFGFGRQRDNKAEPSNNNNNDLDVEMANRMEDLLEPKQNNNNFPPPFPMVQTTPNFGPSFDQNEAGGIIKELNGSSAGPKLPTRQQAESDSDTDEGPEDDAKDTFGNNTFVNNGFKNNMLPDTPQRFGNDPFGSQENENINNLLMPSAGTKKKAGPPDLPARSNNTEIFNPPTKNNNMLFGPPGVVQNSTSEGKTDNKEGFAAAAKKINMLFSPPPGSVKMPAAPATPSNNKEFADASNKLNMLFPPPGDVLKSSPVAAKGNTEAISAAAKNMDMLFSPTSGNQSATAMGAKDQDLSQKKPKKKKGKKKEVETAVNLPGNEAVPVFRADLSGNSPSDLSTFLKENSADELLSPSTTATKLEDKKKKKNHKKHKKNHKNHKEKLAHGDDANPIVEDSDKSKKKKHHHHHHKKKKSSANPAPPVAAAATAQLASDLELLSRPRKESATTVKFNNYGFPANVMVTSETPRMLMSSTKVKRVDNGPSNKVKEDTEDKTPDRVSPSSGLPDGKSKNTKDSFSGLPTNISTNNASEEIPRLLIPSVNTSRTRKRSNLSEISMNATLPKVPPRKVSNISDANSTSNASAKVDQNGGNFEIPVFPKTTRSVISPVDNDDKLESINPQFNPKKMRAKIDDIKMSMNLSASTGNMAAFSSPGYSEGSANAASPPRTNVFSSSAKPKTKEKENNGNKNGEVSGSTETNKLKNAEKLAQLDNMITGIQQSLSSSKTTEAKKEELRSMLEKLEEKRGSLQLKASMDLLNVLDE